MTWKSDSDDKQIHDSHISIGLYTEKEHAFLPLHIVEKRIQLSLQHLASSMSTFIL